jgi:hypothetical protein
MSVRKAPARLRAGDGSVVGEGRAYVHLREPETLPQPAQGTLSLDWWDESAPAPVEVELADGPVLAITVESDRLAGCMLGRILRYQLVWPGVGS